MNRLPFKCLLVILVLILATGTTFAQTGGQMVRLTASVAPALATAQFVGHHDPSSMLNVTVALKLRNTSQLNAFLQAVQDPTSSVYHQFLTPSQFTAMYGPTPTQVSAVVGYLQAQGIHVTGVSRNNVLINIREQSGVLENALDVQINDYLYHGRQVYGTLDSPSFPSSISGYVQAVIGLSDIAQPKPMLILGPLSSSPSGYSPQQIATAYNWPDITNTVNGNGKTIAVFAAQSAGLRSSDYDYFWNYYGLPTHSVTIDQVDGAPGDCGLCDEEATLDIERSGAMAPGASLIVYEAAQDTFADSTDTYSAIANDRLAQVVTISYGATESSLSTGDLTTDDGSFKQMAAEGMEVFVADGDGGSPNCEYGPCDVTANVPVYPVSDPYVVAAGGTTLTLNSNNTIANETAWSYPLSCNSPEFCLGTGGAISNYVVNGTVFWPEPS